MVLSTAGIVQQQVEWYGSVREEGRGGREAGGGKREAGRGKREARGGKREAGSERREAEAGRVLQIASRIQSTKLPALTATAPLSTSLFLLSTSRPPSPAKFDANDNLASRFPLPSSRFPPMTHRSHASEDVLDPLPALERAVADRPDDAKALVALANHYWLIGAGPEAVGDLASRAIASDPDNRAGWHLWALAESNPRERVARWQQVSSRFPADQLAKANLADNAASLAGAEHDYQAVDLAIDTYEELLATAEHPDQRAALEKAIKTLRGWKF